MLPLLALLGIGSTALNIAGNLESNSSAADAAQANANLAKGQAANAYQLGAWRAGLLRTKASQLQGAQKAGYAASGVDVTQGTPLQTMAGTRFMADTDIQTAHNNAARQAWGYLQQAQQYQKQADYLNSWQAKLFAGAGPALGGAGQLLGLFGQSAAQKTPNIAGGP